MSARQTAEERCRGERAYPRGERAYAGRGHARGEGIHGERAYAGRRHTHAAGRGFASHEDSSPGSDDASGAQALMVLEARAVLKKVMTTVAWGNHGRNACRGARRGHTASPTKPVEKEADTASPALLPPP